MGLKSFYKFDINQMPSINITN